MIPAKNWTPFLVMLTLVKTIFSLAELKQHKFALNSTTKDLIYIIINKHFVHDQESRKKNIANASIRKINLVFINNKFQTANKKSLAKSKATTSLVYIFKQDETVYQNKFRTLSKRQVLKKRTQSNNKLALKDSISMSKQIPDVYKKFQAYQFTENETHQFCGETLYYAVEYYCIYIKGTGVYTPDYNFENTKVIGESKKSKRNLLKDSQM